MTSRSIVILLVIVVAVVGGIASYQLVGPPQIPPSNEFQIPPANATEYSFSKEWLNGQNIYVYGTPPLDYLRAVNATGVTWSVYWIGLNSQDQEYVDSLHQNGFKVCSNLPTVQGHIDLVRRDQGLLERASCRDIWGNTSYLSWVTESRIYLMCHNNPEWQEFLRERICENVDGRADAILIDEVEGTSSHLDGAGFCDYCMAGFNSYLSGRYPSSQLLEKFGISNISTFDYRGYLLNSNASNVWGDPNIDLRNEYLRFQYSSRQAQIHALIQHARDYAKRDLLFCANTYGLNPNQQIFVQDLDFMVFEKHLGDLPGGKNIITYLLGEALVPSKPVVVFPDIFNLASLSVEDWWLWRHWLAEAYASGGSFLIPYQAYTAGGGSFTIAAERLTPYTNFIATHADYYRSAYRLMDVAVLYDEGATLFEWSAWESFLNVGLALQEAHIPFEVIYVGDGVFVNKTIGSADLERYAVVVIPSGHRFNATVEALLEQHIQRGGKVIRVGELPAGSDVAAAVRMTGADLVLRTNASKDLGIMVYAKGDSLLVHFVNYNYDYSAHDFLAEGPISVTITLPAGMNLTGKTLRLVSPDAEGRTLEYMLQGQKVTFVVPTIYEYSVAVFE